MPYIKPRDPPFIKVTRLCKAYDLGPVRLAEILGCARNTAASKLKTPGRMTLDDIRAINQRAHIPIEEIREAISL